MRIYNSRTSQISIPLTATEKIVVPGHGTSASFMPNPKILSLIVTSFDYDELALIVTGPIEMTMCSETPCCAGFVVNSLEEALERFAVDVPAGVGMKNDANVKDPLNPPTEAPKAEETEEATPEAPKAVSEPEKAPSEEVPVEKTPETKKKSKK